MLRPAAICDGDITTVERAIAALQQGQFAAAEKANRAVIEHEPEHGLHGDTGPHSEFHGQGSAQARGRSHDCGKARADKKTLTTSRVTTNVRTYILATDTLTFSSILRKENSDARAQSPSV